MNCSALFTTYINTSFLTFDRQAKLVISEDTSPAAQVGRWFVALVLKDSTNPLNPSKNVTITASLGMPYKDYVKPMLLVLFLFPLLTFFFLGVIFYLSYRVQGANLSTKGKYLPKDMRYTEYIWYTVVSFLFFFIPAIQVAFSRAQAYEDLEGNQDGCYYDELCMHPLGPFSDFNNIWSNLGYIVAGLTLIIYIKLLEHLHWRSLVPRDYSILYAVSSAIVGEGVLSAVYHICPSRTIFQFDSAFMFVICALASMELYRKYYKAAMRGSRMFLLIAGILGLNYIGSIINVRSGSNTATSVAETIFKLLFFFLMFVPFFVFFGVGHLYYYEKKTWYGGEDPIISCEGKLPQEEEESDQLLRNIPNLRIDSSEEYDNDQVHLERHNTTERPLRPDEFVHDMDSHSGADSDLNLNPENSSTDKRSTLGSKLNMDDIKAAEVCVKARPIHIGRFAILFILFTLVTLIVFTTTDLSQMFLGILLVFLIVATVAYCVVKCKPPAKKANHHIKKALTTFTKTVEEDEDDRSTTVNIEEEITIEEENESPPPKTHPLIYAIWTLIAIGYVVFGVTSIYFFELPSTNKVLTPWASRDQNHGCILFDFYESHDVWHLLSAFGLFFMTLLLIHFDRDEHPEENRHYKRNLTWKIQA
eukprot:TRINITY_DN18138_c0_g1_i1.p1 TRINITY_DN18138_c0_g1~~TRINITY_DN18138_c0_g1_i1.p1  ORF type:complete len:645 (+),score=110.25 TRINITY_DN18138_c0_g1_i1:186-2120(+)